MVNRLQVELLGRQLKNPLFAASGTFSFGLEAAQIQNTKAWAGIVCSAVTVEPRVGNPLPRVAETDSGMLNAVGLENPGIEVFLRDLLPEVRRITDFVVVNLAGHNPDDYRNLVERTDEAFRSGLIDALEINLSCPNVSTGCMAIGTHADEIEGLIKDLRQRTKAPLWVKLTPNVTHIDEMARAAEAAGADAVSLVNTFLGMKIDVRARRPLLANRTGGLSGPAIRPIAVRMVHEVAQAVKIPVIGMGGIERVEHILEFLLAGATCVQLGTYNLRNPFGIEPLLRELEEWLVAEDCTVRDYIGALEY